MGVFGYFIGYQVNYLFSYICNVVVYVFCIFCNEMQVYIGGYVVWIFYYEGQEFMEECVVYLVDVIVVFKDFLGQFDVVLDIGI